MIAEYMVYAGGPPAPSLPWPLVLAVTDRVQVFDARQRHIALGALDLALSNLFATDATRAAGELRRERLLRLAYPVKGGLSAPMENLAAPPDDEAADG